MFCYSHTSILFYFGRTFNASWSLHGREKWELTVVMICGSRPHTRRYFLFVCSACVWPGLVSFHLAPRRGKAGIWVCSDYVIIISSVIRRLGNELSFFLSLLSFLCFTFIPISHLISFYCYCSPLFSVLFLLHPLISSSSSLSSSSVSHLASLRRSPFLAFLICISFSTCTATCCPTFCLAEHLWGNHVSRLLWVRCMNNLGIIVCSVFLVLIPLYFFFSLSLSPRLYPFFFFTSSFHRRLPLPQYPVISFQDHPFSLPFPFLVPIFFEVRRTREAQTRLEWLEETGVERERWRLANKETWYK